MGDVGVEWRDVAPTERVPLSLLRLGLPQPFQRSNNPYIISMTSNLHEEEKQKSPTSFRFVSPDHALPAAFLNASIALTLAWSWLTIAFG